MATGALLYAMAWAVSSLLLGVTGAAKTLARKMGNPDSWECAVAGGVLGVVILAAASWPWPQRGRG